MIDEVDSEILGLLSKRMLLSIRAGRIKERIEDRGRELEILASLARRRDPLLSSSFSEILYGKIITESKRLQRENFKLAGFQGVRGAFGEIACEVFDKSLIPVPCMEFSDVFDGVSNGELDLGIVPIENSTEGNIIPVIHLVTERDLSIVGEVVLPIHHCLLGLQNVNFGGVKVVYSHPQALDQCRNFITQNKFEPRPFYDTAGAAAMVAREKPVAAAAIAGAICSDIYGLKILKEEIEDSKSNFTRFIILSRRGFSEEGDKCTITFSTKDRVGALSTILNIFEDARINLTMIESLPSRDSSGRSKFLVDFAGHLSEKRTTDALQEIKDLTIGFRLLGCYRSWPR